MKQLIDGAVVDMTAEEMAEYQQMYASTPVPSQVSMRQARLALLSYGLLAQVDAAITSMPGVEGEAARIEWEYAAEVRRDSALVASMSGVLGLTGAQLDALFIQAATL